MSIYAYMSHHVCGGGLVRCLFMTEGEAIKGQVTDIALTLTTENVIHQTINTRSKERLGLYTVENLGPRAFKGKVLKLQRSLSNMRRHGELSETQVNGGPYDSLWVSSIVSHPLVSDPTFYVWLLTKIRVEEDER